MTNFETNSIIINQICKVTEPGKKMLQKLMYLIERKGVDLDLDYSIHFFGPYSSKLDDMMHVLESYDELSIDTSGVTHVIRLGDIPISGALTNEDQQKVDFVLDHFVKKTAHELEAITTLDYVATVMFRGQGTDQQIIDKVKQIKGTKFSIDYLTDGMNTLKQCSYL